MQLFALVYFYNTENSDDAMFVLYILKLAAVCMHKVPNPAGICLPLSYILQCNLRFYNFYLNRSKTPVRKCRNYNINVFIKNDVICAMKMNQLECSFLYSPYIDCSRK